MNDMASECEGPVEIAFVGDLTENEAELCEKLLSVPVGGECTLYIDSPGGSAYSAISFLTLISTRQLQATGVVTGECSSAAIWPFAACTRRLVTPYSVFLFHAMKWQSEEHVPLAEATEWARHFGHLEKEMDALLATFFEIPEAQLEDWIRPGRYITGPELVEAGLAELMELKPVQRQSGTKPPRKEPRALSRKRTAV